MGRIPWLLVFFLLLASWTFAQKTPTSPAPTSPADETRTPAAVRSVHSMGGDLMVPLCPARFHDSLRTNGIAGSEDKQVVRPAIKTSVPAKITEQAIAASDKTHIGNYIVIVNVVVDSKGNPGNLCLQKSSGYGLDAAAASAVAQYRFEPAKLNGKPVRMRIPVEVEFANPIVGMNGNPANSGSYGD